MGRKGSYPNNLPRELDDLHGRSDKVLTRLKNLEQGMSQMQDDMTSALSVPNPADPFLVDRETKEGGELPTVEILLSGVETEVTLVLMRREDIPASGATTDQIKAARAKRLTFELTNITDEEREAKVMRRALRPASSFEFLTTYAAMQIKARTVENGRVGEATNPSTNPFKTAPFPILNKVSPNGVVDGPAIFTTCDSTGTNCPDATVLAGAFRPGIMPATGVASTFKSNKAGVKPTLNFTIPQTAEEVTVEFVDLPNFNPTADTPQEAIKDSFLVTKKERMLGSISRKSNVRFDFGTTYILTKAIVTGDNVGGPGRNRLRLLATSDAGILDTQGARAQFTTPAEGDAGGGGVGMNAGLVPDIPFVPSTINANTQLPDFYVLEEEGCYPIMRFLLPPAGAGLPSAVTDLAAVIIPANAYANGNFDRNFRTDWDDITTAEQLALKAQRQFSSELLKYSRTYHLIQIIGQGSNLGGPGVNTAKNPLPRIPAGETMPRILASFTTPNANGVFANNGIGALQFLGIFGRRANKRGVIVTMRIGVPTGTRECTVRVEQVDGPGRGTIFDHTFTDVEFTSRSDNQPGAQFQAEFPHRLEPGENTNITYRIKRLVAVGKNINPDLAFSKSRDTVRNPINGPATDNSLGSFITASSLGYIALDGITKAQVPATPSITDIINLPLTMDQPQVFVGITASQFGNSIPPPTFAPGSGAGGAVTFGDIGADTVGVVFRSVGQGPNTSFSAPIDNLSAVNQVIEIPGLVFAKQYELVAVFVGGGGETKRAQPLTTVRFRAGGEIDISLLPFTDIAGNIDTPPVLASSNRIQILEFLRERATEGRVRIGYNEPLSGSAVLLRRIRLSKFIQGKSTAFKEFGSGGLLLKEDAANFTPGPHIFEEDLKFPENARVTIRAELIPLQGGGASVIDEMTFDTGVDGGGQDSGLPFYQNVFSSARLRWKPQFIRVAFTLPDQNMKTFAKVRLLYLFTAKTGAISGNVWAVHPETKQFQRFSFPLPINSPSVPALDQDSLIFVDNGNTPKDSPDLERPDQTSDGGLNIFDFTVNKTIGQALRDAFNAGQQASLEVRAYIYNQFPTTGLIAPALEVQVGTIFWPFLPF